jgi:integral membrane protein (TIGR00529 family)
LDILGVFAALFLIVFLVRKNLNVGWAMIIAALVISGFAKMTFENTLIAFKKAIFSDTFINLALMVLFISLLGYIMKKTGALDLMIKSLISLLGGGKLLVITIPSIIGLLTVPGGAILSAPMVEESGRKLGLEKEQMTAINIFFRHIWFPIYPLYPALLLVSGLTGISSVQIILLSLLPVLVAVVVGSKTLFKGAITIEKNGEIDKVKGLKGFIYSMLPVFTILFLALVLDIYFPLAVFIGVIIALFSFLNKGENPLSRVKTMVFPGINFSMVISVLGIMVFKEVLEASSVLSNLMVRMMELGLPIGLLGFISALCSGLITGSNTASLGITLPVFLPLLGESPLPYILLIFMASLLGYVLSPVHLCLILTKQHFNCDYKGFYKLLFWPAFFMIFTTIIIAYLLLFL